ncbi:MAG: hypothetical protein JWQ43_1471 [Glaciihabitans sp.]|nr:hypothetical protein [Glaciihabitans sp.]
MSDLVVSRSVLEDSSAKLKAIKEEFDTAGKRVAEDADVWGQRDVASAMNSFVNNWSIHRGKISTAVGDLQKKVDDAAVAWTETEQNLTDGLTTESS